MPVSESDDAHVEPANRADLAEALARLLRADELLAGAVAVNEAWAMGYIAQLLVHAEVLAAQSSTEVYHAITTSAEDAVREALFNANPKLIFDRWRDPIPEAVTAGLLEMLDVQARFHRAAVVLERRGLRREPPRF